MFFSFYKSSYCSWSWSRSWSRSVVPVPPYFWSRPWSRSKCLVPSHSVHCITQSTALPNILYSDNKTDMVFSQLSYYMVTIQHASESLHQTGHLSQPLYPLLPIAYRCVTTPCNATMYLVTMPYHALCVGTRSFDQDRNQNRDRDRDQGRNQKYDGTGTGTKTRTRNMMEPGPGPRTGTRFGPGPELGPGP